MRADDALFLAMLVYWPVFVTYKIVTGARRNRGRPGFAPPAPGIGTPPAYRAAPSLLTPAEAQFYAALREAVGPGAVIQCKVRLADILVSRPDDLPAFRRVSQKHVDFLLCHPSSLKPLLAIELDDRSHDRPDRRERDAFIDAAYHSAGLAVLHIPLQDRYDGGRLLALIQPHLITRASYL